MKKIICLAAVLLLATAVMFADIARPGKTPVRVPKPGSNTSAGMTIHLDSNIKQPTLRLPKSSLKYLRAAIDDNDVNTDNTAAATTGGFSRTQTFVSGVFLSLAFVFGGMWFVRSGKAATKSGKTLVILAVIAGMGSAATIVYGDIAPPPSAPITSRIFDKKAFGELGYASERMIRIETSEGSDVELYVPDLPARPTRDEE